MIQRRKCQQEKDNHAATIKNESYAKNSIIINTVNQQQQFFLSLFCNEYFNLVLIKVMEDTNAEMNEVNNDAEE